MYRLDTIPLTAHACRLRDRRSATFIRQHFAYLSCTVLYPIPAKRNAPCAETKLRCFVRLQLQICPRFDISIFTNNIMFFSHLLAVITTAGQKLHQARSVDASKTRALLGQVH